MRRVAPAIIALAIGLMGCSQNDSDTSQQEKKPVVDVAAGKIIAERQCKGCHGLDGKGTGPAIPTLAGQPAPYLLASLAEYKDGRRTHAALRSMMEQLSDTDARNVAAYFAGLPPVDASSARNVQLFSPYETGKKIAVTCGQCHGPDGNSKTPGTPNLAGQQPRYFATAVHEYLVGSRGTPSPMPPMHMLVRDMRPVDVDSVALYFASQTPAQRPHRRFRRPGERRAAHRAVRRLPRPARGQQRPCDAKSGRPGSPISRQCDQGLPQRRGYSEPMVRVVAGLTDADINNIAAFYTMQKVRPAVNGQALMQELTQRCNRCHGAGVSGSDIAIPKLNGQDMDYLVMALRSYRDNRRQTSVMHNMVLPYGDAIIEGLASYYASQPAK